MKLALALFVLIGTAWLASPEPSCAQGRCLSGLPCYNSVACGQQGCACILINGPGRQGVCG